MDIVWAGQYAENGYTVDLTEWMKRDAAELKLDDIYPTLLNALGHYGDKQVAFPFAGYANVLAYRKDLYDAAGLKAPATMEEMTAAAFKLTDPAKKIYGFVANGQKGPAVAQDWMQTSKASRSIRNCSTKRPLPAPSTTTGVAVRKVSGRVSLQRCRPGPSAHLAITILRFQRSSIR
jgi:hypothetical protein